MGKKEFGPKERSSLIAADILNTLRGLRPEEISGSYLEGDVDTAIHKQKSKEFIEMVDGLTSPEIEIVKSMIDEELKWKNAK